MRKDNDILVSEPHDLDRMTGLKETAAMPYESINPCGGKVLQIFEELTDDQFKRALQTSASCFETWRHMIFTERAAVATELVG